jgi:hypothetical protein
VPTGRPPAVRPPAVAQGTLLERAASFFVGGAPRLRMEEVVHTPGDRFRLQTQAGGVAHLRLGAAGAAATGRGGGAGLAPGVTAPRRAASARG